MLHSLRWTLILAILGFILGLGFLIPLSGGPETRAPASAPENTIAFLPPKWNADSRPAARAEKSSDQARLFERDLTGVDPRTDLLFDIHTISRSAFAKNTDAYVTTRFTSRRRDQIDRFTYCHNYDYDKQRARTNLNRYSLGDDGFDCYSISLSELASGYTLIDTPLGKVLSLQSEPGFSPSYGGTVSVLFAFHVAKIGRNDYRKLDLRVALIGGRVRITGPKGEAFDWFNLKMTEDLFTLPNGVNAFELYSEGAKVPTYFGEDMPKLAVTKD